MRQSLASQSFIYKSGKLFKDEPERFLFFVFVFFFCFVLFLLFLFFLCFFLLLFYSAFFFVFVFFLFFCVFIFFSFLVSNANTNTNRVILFHEQ